LREARAEELANFCLATGIQPSEYKALTMEERNAFVAAANRMNKRR
jgi:hypothetical protein